MLVFSNVVFESNLWWQALTSHWSLVSLAVIFVCFAVMIIGIRALLGSASQEKPRWRDLFRSERGTATIEFTLVFPILLFLSLMLLQSTLLMGGNIFVHYAAYAAARSAIVQIPANSFNEGYPPITDGATDANQITAAFGTPKFDAINRAAVLALIPVAGREASLTSRLIDEQQYVEAMTMFLRNYGQNPPNWVERLLADRVRYAAEYTDIEIGRVERSGSSDVSFVWMGEGETWQFRQKEAIAVRVIHDFNLSVPWASLVFADGNNDSPGPGKYTTMTARAILTNEGIRDELPPRPDLPRLDP